MIAFGDPAWPPPQSIGFSWSPIVGFVLILVLLRYVARSHVGWAQFACSIVGGTVFSIAIDAWGIPVVVSLLVLGSSAVNILRRRSVTG